MNKARILVIEDDPDFRESLSLLLESRYQVDTVDTGLMGLKSAIRNPPDLILLDLKMPDLDGFQTCKGLRTEEEFNDIPIIVISGYGSPDDRSRALELGANDFVAKPLLNADLLRRVEQQLERSNRKAPASAPPKTSSSHGNLEFDFTNQIATVDSQKIQLSTTEIRILHLLASSLGQMVTREEILQKVWQQQSVNSRIIDPHMVSLRNKIKAVGYTVTSVYGSGYVLREMVS